MRTSQIGGKAKKRRKRATDKRDMQHKFSCSTWIGRSAKNTRIAAKMGELKVARQGRSVVLTTSKAQQRGATERSTGPVNGRGGGGWRQVKVGYCKRYGHGFVLLFSKWLRIIKGALLQLHEANTHIHTPRKGNKGENGGGKRQKRRGRKHNKVTVSHCQRQVH